MQWAAWQGLRRAAGLPGTPRPALTSPTGPGTQPIDVQSWAPAPHGAQPPTAAAGPSWPPPPAPGRQQAGNWIPVLSGFQPCREGGIFSFPSWKPTGSCPTVAQQCRLQAQATSPTPQHQVPRRGAVHPERLAQPPPGPGPRARPRHVNPNPPPFPFLPHPMGGAHEARCMGVLSQIRLPQLHQRTFYSVR